EGKKASRPASRAADRPISRCGSISRLPRRWDFQSPNSFLLLADEVIEHRPLGTTNRLSTARRDVTQNDLRHLQIVATTSRAETFRNTVTVLHVAILAHLPLALDPPDDKAEADDAPQHRIYVGRGGI